MRYILALSPPKHFASLLIETANKLFAPYSREYLLSPNSLPHITLYQYECKTDEQALIIWSQLKRDFSSELVPKITGVAFIKKGNLYQVELSVKRSRSLMERHLLAKKYIQAKAYKGLTEDGDLYRPHITLAQIDMPINLPKWPDSILDNQSPFTLTLGVGNDLGQYLREVAE